MDRRQLSILIIWRSANHRTIEPIHLIHPWIFLVQNENNFNHKCETHDHVNSSRTNPSRGCLYFEIPLRTFIPYSMTSRQFYCISVWCADYELLLYRLDVRFDSSSIFTSLWTTAKWRSTTFFFGTKKITWTSKCDFQRCLCVSTLNTKTINYEWTFMCVALRRINSMQCVHILTEHKNTRPPHGIRTRRMRKTKKWWIGSAVHVTNGMKWNRSNGKSTPTECWSNEFLTTVCNHVRSWLIAFLFSHSLRRMNVLAKNSTLLPSFPKISLRRRLFIYV